MPGVTWCQGPFCPLTRARVPRTRALGLAPGEDKLDEFRKGLLSIYYPRTSRMTHAQQPAALNALKCLMRTAASSPVAVSVTTSVMLDDAEIIGDADDTVLTEEAFHKAILCAPIDVPLASTRPARPVPSRTSHARTRSPVESSSALYGQQTHNIDTP
jgi:hypothetical protein